MKIDINDLTIGQLKELSLFSDNKRSSPNPFKIGKAYFIRTVTMNHIGVLKEIYDNELVLAEVSWIADSGRFHNALKDGDLNDVEPFLDEVIIGRNSIVDMTEWRHEVKQCQK